MDYLSTFRIPIDKIPQAKNWKVGGRYKVVADVEQTGVNKERDYKLEDGPVLSTGKKTKPRYRTMVEFKVYDVNAAPLDKALKKRVR